MIDLHVHTTYSDGEYSPLEILKLCNEKGISKVAITDHGAIEGAKIALNQNPYSNITVISGIEFTAIYPVKQGNLHILGYNMDMENEALNNVTQAIVNASTDRFKKLITLLKVHYGIAFDFKDVNKVLESRNNVGRPEIAKLCVDYGYTKNVDEAFKKYLNPLNKFVRRGVELTDKECIEYITNAGGIACLAHPIELRKDIDELREYIKTLISYGLSAIEVYQSKHNAEYTEEMLSIAEDFGLLYSVGSDYHGPVVTPDIEIGKGTYNNLCMNYASILTKF